MARRAPDEHAEEAEALARLATGPEAGRCVQRLYVTGMTLRSMRAIANYQHPQLARDEQIVAAPTLIKKLPLPLRRIVGDLSDEDRVLLGLDLRAKKTA